MDNRVLKLEELVNNMAEELRLVIEKCEGLERHLVKVKLQGEENVRLTRIDNDQKDQLIARLSEKTENLEQAAILREARIVELANALAQGKVKFDEEVNDNLNDKQRLERLLMQMQSDIQEVKDNNATIGRKSEPAPIDSFIIGERDRVERAKQAVLGVKLRFTGDVRISHPMQFLRTFERITGRIGLSGDQRMIVLGEACLTGAALSWFLESDAQGYEQFTREFEGKYWTSKEHNRLMDEVNANVLKLDKGEIISEYVGRIVREVSYLPYPMEDSYLAKRLIRKFNEELRNLLLTTVNSTAQLIKALSTLENEDSQILKGKKGQLTDTVSQPPQNQWNTRNDWRDGQQRNQNSAGYPRQGHWGPNRPGISGQSHQNSNNNPTPGEQLVEPQGGPVKQGTGNTPPKN